MRQMDGLQMALSIRQMKRNSLPPLQGVTSNKSPSRQVKNPAFQPGFEASLVGAKTDLRGHHAQRTGRGLGIKHNPRLLQNPRFNLFMVQCQ